MPAWLYRTAKNVVVDEFRRQKRTVAVLRISDLGAELMDRRSAALLEAAQIRELLRVAFGTLSPAAQVLWLLYYHEGLKSSEIAAVLEIPEGTVKTRLSRTRESLRRAYRAQEMGGPLRQHRKTAGKSAASTSEKELEAWFTSML